MEEEEESDSLAKALWIIILIPLILLAIFFYNANKQKELQRNYQIEKSTETEIKVDLNDYFNSSTGWDDNTDWNCTDFSSEESYQAFNKVLRDNNIYWSEQKQSWVKKVGKDNKCPKIEFE